MTQPLARTESDNFLSTDAIRLAEEMWVTLNRDGRATSPAADHNDAGFDNADHEILPNPFSRPTIEHPERPAIKHGAAGD